MKGKSGLFKNIGHCSSIKFESENQYSSFNKTKVCNNNVREQLLSIAKQEETKRLINDNFRPQSTYGNGGTADAIKYELETGKTVGGKSHLQKGRETINRINNILNKEPNHPDKTLLENIRKELENALSTKKGDYLYEQ